MLPMKLQENPTYGFWSDFSSAQGRTADDLPVINSKPHMYSQHPADILKYAYKPNLDLHLIKPDGFIPAWAKYTTDIKLLSIDHDNSANKSRGSFLLVCRHINRIHKPAISDQGQARVNQLSGTTARQ